VSGDHLSSLLVTKQIMRTTFLC